MDITTKKIILLIFVMTSFLSCNYKAEVNEPIVIHLQPFNGIPKSNVTFVHDELQKIYPHIEVNESIALPEAAYYKERNRYRADSLIKFLGTITPKGHVTIGLTDKDISHTKGKIQDYGIMGLGYQPGSSCVVSTFRLSKANLLEQFFKLSIHELGHTQGLPHCSVKTCLMRDAKGKNHIDEITGFCSNCKKHLSSKGWTL